MTSGLAIEARGLTKRYGDVVALDALDLAVPTGSVFGFLGPNGAGKTTTLRLLTGLGRATAGTAVVAGIEVGRGGTALARRIGYLDQDPRFYGWMTGRELLTFVGPGLRAGRGGPPVAGRRGPRDRRAQRCRPTAHRRVLRRHAPAAGGRAGDAAPAGRPPPRRAGQRARSGRPARHPGADRAPAWREHRPHEHPHPHRRRADLRPGRDPRSRAPRRRGPHGRAAGPPRPPDPGARPGARPGRRGGDARRRPARRRLDARGAGGPRGPAGDRDRRRAGRRRGSPPRGRGGRAAGPLRAGPADPGGRLPPARRRRRSARRAAGTSGAEPSGGRCHERLRAPPPQGDPRAGADDAPRRRGGRLRRPRPRVPGLRALRAGDRRGRRRRAVRGDDPGADGRRRRGPVHEEHRPVRRPHRDPRHDGLGGRGEGARHRRVPPGQADRSRRVRHSQGRRDRGPARRGARRGRCPLLDLHDDPLRAAAGRSGSPPWSP